MPHVISLQCANPECTAHIDSEELHVWNDVIHRGPELIEDIDRHARLDGWQKVPGNDWQCKECQLVEKEFTYQLDLRRSAAS